MAKKIEKLQLNLPDVSGNISFETFKKITPYDISNIKKDEFQTLLQKFGSENYTNASFGEPFSHLTIPI